jgi:hypothetical protein
MAVCGVNYDVQTWTLTNLHSVIKTLAIIPNNCKIMPHPMIFSGLTPVRDRYQPIKISKCQ